MVLAQAGVVGQHDPAVHLDPGVRQRRRGRPVRVRVRHPVLDGGAQRPARPALRVGRVEDGGVAGGDHAVVRVAGVSARVEW